MAILQKTTTPIINISSANTVLAYVHPASANDAIVFIRVDLGDPNPISGGGIYKFTAFVNNQPIAPTSNVTVNSGDTEAKFQAREVSLEAGDVLEVSVEGRAPDTMVSSVAIVQDATPIRAEEFEDIVGFSEVAQAVDHNWQGADNYQYITKEGVPVGDAQVLVYLRSDYDAFRRSNDYLKGVTSTNVNGRWRKQVMLDPESYIVQFHKSGKYGPDTAALTV